MKAKYSIHQIKCNVSYKFEPFIFAKKEFDFENDYDKVYESEIEGDSINGILEKLYYIFNVEHPKDFIGHSLSMSDVVILNSKMYYCDTIGWTFIKNIN